MKRILYAILIFFGLAAQHDVLCSQKEYPKKEKDGLTLARNNKSKKHEFGDAQEVKIILAQAWKGLKGSEKRSDEEILRTIDSLQHDIQLHIGKFLWSSDIIQRKLRSFIPSIAPQWSFDHTSRIRNNLIFWSERFENDYKNAKIIYLDPKHIIYFNGMLIPTRIHKDDQKKYGDLFDAYERNVPKNDQTLDINHYLKWLQNSKGTFYDLKKYPKIEFIFGLVGYSDGTWQWVIHPFYMACIKNLTYDQFMLNIELDIAQGVSYNRTKSDRALVINDRMKRVFYTLPKFMQHNLIFHRGIVLDEKSLIYHRPGFWDHIGCIGILSLLNF